MLFLSKPMSFEYYFTFDDLVVIHNTDYKIVQDVYNNYYEKYGYKHKYNLYTVCKYDLKEC